jgi:hypothetical protein
VAIEGVETDECPKSLIIRNPEACDLVRIHNQAQSVKGAMGAPARWPGWFFDAMALLREQQAIDKAARQTAISNVTR